MILEYPPIEYTPGLKTLKNFISTEFQPLGTTLYVFGGGWDFQGVGTSNECRTLGISPNWVIFFDEQNMNYTYKYENNKKESYYPFGSFNEYYYVGLDCSGFVGWTIYNTFYDKNLSYGGFEIYAKSIAKNMEEKNYGKWMDTVKGSTFEEPDYEVLAEELKVGDILSTKGHVYFCLFDFYSLYFILLSLKYILVIFFSFISFQ